jgi:hypothetical protein
MVIICVWHSSWMYIKYMQGLFQSRLGTADYALVTSSLHYNDSLVTSNIFIFMILDDFCLLPAWFCYVIIRVYVWHMKSLTHISNRWALRKIANGDLGPATNFPLVALRHGPPANTVPLFFHCCKHNCRSDCLANGRYLQSYCCLLGGRCLAPVVYVITRAQDFLFVRFLHRLWRIQVRTVDEIWFRLCSDRLVLCNGSNRGACSASHTSPFETCVWLGNWSTLLRLTAGVFHIHFSEKR